jgi:hypothetical protein
VTETSRTVFVSTLTHPDQWTHPQLTVRSADIARLMYCMEMFQWLKQLWRSLTQKKAPPSAEALIVPELLPPFWTRGQRSYITVFSFDALPLLVGIKLIA